MFTAFQKHFSNIIIGRRRRPSSDHNDDTGIQETSFDRPSIRVSTILPVNQSRWFGSKQRNRQVDSHQEFQVVDNANNVSVTNSSNTNNAMPLLYSLARSWAWEAVSFRCTTHPHEVDVKYRDYNNDTCLHWVVFGRPPISTVQALLSVCPELSQSVNATGSMPLHIACSYRASSLVIKEILSAYPQAAAKTDSYGATPLHYLCDYGSGGGSETISSIEVLLQCPFGIQSVVMHDYRYHRRPLFILNTRKNIREQQCYTEQIRSRRLRQRAIRNDLATSRETNWDKELQLDLIDRLEDDIQNIYQENEFWIMVSLLVVAEYHYTINQSRLHRPIFERKYLNYPRHITSSREANSIDETDQVELLWSDNMSNESIVLLSFVQISDCSPSLQEYAILLYEPYLLIPDETNDRRLPLHVAASMYRNCATHGNTGPLSLLLLLLVDGCPEAASKRDDFGILPLTLILNHNENRTTQPASESPKIYWSKGLAALIEAYPIALLEVETLQEENSLWGYLLSLLGNNPDAIYTILRSNPSMIWCLPFDNSNLRKK